MLDFGIAGKTAVVCASSKGLGYGCADALAAVGVVGDDAAVANALGTHDLRLSRLDDGRNVIEPQ